MTLIGLLWAAFAPALLLIPTAGLWALLRFTKIPVQGLARWGLAAILPLLVVVGLWMSDHADFKKACRDLGETKIYQTRSVDGFFLDDSTANSFGMRYLQEEGFRWFESRSIYKRSGFTHYEKTAKGIESKEIDRLSADATISVAAPHEQIGRYISVSRTIITDLPSGKVLAESGRAYFSGGRAFIVLGVWGSDTCPDLRRAAGENAFSRDYHLAKLVLRNEKR